MVDSRSSLGYKVVDRGETSGTSSVVGRRQNTSCVGTGAFWPVHAGCKLGWLYRGTALAVLKGDPLDLSFRAKRSFAKRMILTVEEPAFSCRSCVALFQLCALFGTSELVPFPVVLLPTTHPTTDNQEPHTALLFLPTTND
jgi:hypothetical protein